MKANLTTLFKYYKIYFSMLLIVFKASKKMFLANILLVIVKSITPIVSLFVLKQIIDVVTNASKHNFSVVVNWIFIFCIVLFVQSISNQLFQHFNSLYQYKINDFLTRKVLKKAINISYDYYENPAYNDNLHLSQTQVNYKSGQLVSAYFGFFQQFITTISIISFLWYYNALFALLIIVMSIPLYAISIWFSKSIFTLEKKLTPKERQASYYSLLLSSLQYAKDVRVFGFGKEYLSRFTTIRNYIFKKRKNINDSQSKYIILVEIFEVLITGFVFFSLANNVWQSTMTLAVFVIYLQGFQRLQSSMKATLQSLVSLYRLRLFVEHINMFLAIKIIRKQGKVSMPKLVNQITVSNLSFSYPNTDKEVLEDVSMNFNKGELIAIVGENGSGKSTFIKILSKLYQQKSGDIKINNIDLKDINTIDFRNNSTFVFQDNQQYYISVADNITLGSKIDYEKLKDAAYKASASEFIEKLPKKFDTLLGRIFYTGEQLSGGQWQKIAMSRMFYKNTGLILLDEPTSAIDANAEYELLKNIKKINENKIIVFVTHRLYNLKIADKIYLLKDGKIHEEGTFNQLINSEGAFAEMYKKQLFE